MPDKAGLIAKLGLGTRPPKEQDALYDEFTLELGAAISDGLSDEQMDEFTRIIDDEQVAIDAWLAAHAPNYRTDPDYRQLEIGYREDLEKVPADKVFASIGWIRTNRPDFAQVVEHVTREFRAMIDTQGAA